MCEAREAWDGRNRPGATVGSQFVQTPCLILRGLGVGMLPGLHVLVLITVHPHFAPLKEEARLNYLFPFKVIYSST